MWANQYTAKNTSKDPVEVLNKLIREALSNEPGRGIRDWAERFSKEFELLKISMSTKTAVKRRRNHKTYCEKHGLSYSISGICEHCYLKKYRMSKNSS